METTKSRAAGYAVLAIVLILVLGIAGTFLGLANGWFQKEVKIRSADHVETQYTDVIGAYNDLMAAADNVCNVTAEKEEIASTNAQYKQSPTMAYKATYNQLASKYAATLENHFKAKEVAPPGFPKASQVDAIDKSDWCTVRAQLAALKTAK